jgi:hypothetical protein
MRRPADGGCLTVRIGDVLEAVQHLDLEDAVQEDPAVAAPLAVTLHL